MTSPMDLLSTSLLTRRGMIGRATLGMTGLGLAQWLAAGEILAAEKPAIEPLNRFPRMVHEYFVRRVRQAEEAGNRRRAALNSQADAQAYVEAVREKIAQCFFPVVPEKTPLNPRITGMVDRDAYTIEKVIFESRPRFPA